LSQLLYSHGEPAGIGVDLILRLASLKFWEEINIPIITLADGELLKARANNLNINIQFIELTNLKQAKKNKIGFLQFYFVSPCEDFSPGKLNPKNAKYVLTNLNFAIKSALKNKKIGIVTGPIQKSNIVNGGFKKFYGHTEWIQSQTKSKNVVMLLASKKIKVALATTHIPLADVAKSIKKAKLVETIKIVNAALKKNFQIKRPIIKLLGLNPHAGENGKIGNEELKIINPAARICQKIGINVSESIPADTAFNSDQLKNTDAYIAMFHDQGLPVLKALSFGESFNITLGVPIIRTSVDHGTALEIAGKLKPKLGSIKEAFKQAEMQLK
jgi:4-hydroxythreonine-4-phosphate dehydrogenase